MPLNELQEEESFKVVDIRFEKKPQKHSLMEDEEFHYGSLLKNTA